MKYLRMKNLKVRNVLVSKLGLWHQCTFKIWNVDNYTFNGLMNLYQIAILHSNNLLVKNLSSFAKTEYKNSIDSCIKYIHLIILIVEQLNI